MQTRSRYRRRRQTLVSAVQVRLELESDGFAYRKWGGAQRCKKGDWLVDNQGDVYSVDQTTFANTYREVSPGRYEKHTDIWAARAEADGEISTKEGSTQYRRGDYLVFNDESGGDGYAVSAERFDALYEPVAPDS
jgi:hypothetical protein